MNSFDAILLGIIQALTEFLPVSSSGHLVLGQELFGIDTGGGIAFEVAVHLGTLFTVVFYYRQELVQLINSLAKNGVQDGSLSGWRAVGYYGIASVPAAVIGLGFKDELQRMFGAPVLVSVALIVTGIVLLSTQYAERSKASFSWRTALLVGCAQACAILPGVSRSGSTIAAALWLGISRRDAAQFSFILSIPVIAGASLLQLLDLLAQSPPPEVWRLLAISAFVAFAVGLLALRFLLKMIDRGAFPRFGWYCILAGTVTLILLKT